MPELAIEAFEMEAFGLTLVLGCQAMGSLSREARIFLWTPWCIFFVAMDAVSWWCVRRGGQKENVGQQPKSDSILPHPTPKELIALIASKVDVELPFFECILQLWMKRWFSERTTFHLQP